MLLQVLPCPLGAVALARAECTVLQALRLVVGRRCLQAVGGVDLRQAQGIAGARYGGTSLRGALPPASSSPGADTTPPYTLAANWHSLAASLLFPFPSLPYH